MPLSKARNKAWMRLYRASKTPEAKLQGLERSREYASNRKLKVKGRIYFVFDEQSNAVKIGIADNPDYRLISLQTGNPHKLQLLRIEVGATVARELELHQQFAQERLQGEWFSFTGKLKEYLSVEPAVPSDVVQPETQFRPNKYAGHWKLKGANVIES